MFGNKICTLWGVPLLAENESFFSLTANQTKIEIEIWYLMIKNRSIIETNANVWFKQTIVDRKTTFNDPKIEKLIALGRRNRMM